MSKTELFDVVGNQKQQLALPGNGIHDVQYTRGTQKAVLYQHKMHLDEYPVVLLNTSQQGLEGMRQPDGNAAAAPHLAKGMYDRQYL